MTVESIEDPRGREWRVRSYRYRRPPWRAFDAVSGLSDTPIDTLLSLALAPVTYVLIPALVYPFEAAARALGALVDRRRWIEAVQAGPPRVRMTWVTDAEHEQAVLEQVANQVRLGYTKVQPHRARLLGFD